MLVMYCVAVQNTLGHKFVQFIFIFTLCVRGGVFQLTAEGKRI